MNNPKTLIKTVRGLSSNQREIDNSDPLLLKSFKASSQLYNQLTKDYKRQENSESIKGVFISSGKELLKQAKIEKEMARTSNSYKNQISLESEVVALSNFEMPKTRDQTKDLIARQRESRRDRHIQQYKEFEKWVERLNKNLDEAYKDIKKEVVDFFENSDKSIIKYNDSLSDEELIKQEKVLLDLMKQNILGHKSQREKKISNLQDRLDELENDRQKKLWGFCDKISETLVDIAFMLRPEVEGLIIENRLSYSASVEEKKQLNKIYTQQVNQRQTDSFIKYEQIMKDKEQRWRQLKHDMAISTFKQDLQKWEYRNPIKRVELYKEFKLISIQIYKKRVEQIEILGNLELNIISKSYMDKYLEQIKQNNEQASLKIDDCFDKLVEEDKETNTKTINRYTLLSNQLFYAGFLNHQDIQDLLDNILFPIASKLQKDSQDLMKQAIKYVEDADGKQMDVINNMAQFYMKLGIKADEYRRDFKQLISNYEIEKAQTADKNDENIEKMQEEYEILKVSLAHALHHPKLQQAIEECFNKLDDIEDEFRDFHELNQSLVKNHPDAILRYHQKFESNSGVLFELVSEQQRQSLEQEKQRDLENEAKRILSKEEYIKRIEEERQMEDAKNKKGGKAPTVKPKDPKKYAQEMEDRLKEIVKQLSSESIKGITSNLNINYLESMPMREIAERMYLSTEELEKQMEEKLHQKQKHQQEQDEADKIKQDPKSKAVAVPLVFELPEYIPENDIPRISVDAKLDAPMDPQENIILSSDIVIELDFIISVISRARTAMFDFVFQKNQETQVMDQRNGHDFLEESMLLLDERLKKHYPMKGKTEVEIMQVRSSQITLHKQRYERHAKLAYERLDFQTEQVNFFIEGALGDMREYEKQQRNLRDGLQSANTLAKLQGMHNTIKENYFKFGEKINEVEEKLQSLSSQELDQITQKNREFLRDSRLFEQGGDYSQEEVEWYGEMMKELGTLIDKSHTKRKNKKDELLHILQSRKQEHLDSFEKEYATAVEDLAAKEGTGKKYGRPKRLAQERLRTEMTKCEKAQESISHKIGKLKKMYELYTLKVQDPIFFYLSNPSFSLQIRRILMSLQTCIKRYSFHIEALRSDSKAQEIPRISYNESKFDTILDPDQIEQDRKFIEEDLESMGPLYFQKDQKKFIEWVTDIEKVIKEEGQKTYTGDKAKYLTGVDKVPDYLRAYIETMRRNMEDFRTQSIRELRKSCDEISELAQPISKMLFDSINHRYRHTLHSDSDVIEDQFKQQWLSIEILKEKHLARLRPNLGNPQCKEELKELQQVEKQRLSKWMEQIKVYQRQLLEKRFQNGAAYFKCSLQNFEFLLLYFDSIILLEDFVKLPGDEQIQKKHQSLKVSLRQKQSGSNIDTASERSLMKEWEGRAINSFDANNMKVEYFWSPNMAVVGEVKDLKKKDDKKPSKDDKKTLKGEQSNLEESHVTKSLKSFKTFRQKAAHHCFVESFRVFQIEYSEYIQETNSKFKNLLEKEMKFEFKWEQNVQSLFKFN